MLGYSNTKNIAGFLSSRRPHSRATDKYKYNAGATKKLLWVHGNVKGEWVNFSHSTCEGSYTQGCFCKVGDAPNGPEG